MVAPRNRSTASAHTRRVEARVLAGPVAMAALHRTVSATPRRSAIPACRCLRRWRRVRCLVVGNCLVRCLQVCRARAPVTALLLVCKRFDTSAGCSPVPLSGCSGDRRCASERRPGVCSGRSSRCRSSSWTVAGGQPAGCLRRCRYGLQRACSRPVQSACRGPVGQRLRAPVRPPAFQSDDIDN